MKAQKYLADNYVAEIDKDCEKRFFIAFGASLSAIVLLPAITVLVAIKMEVRRVDFTTIAIASLVVVLFIIQATLALIRVLPAWIEEQRRKQ